MGKSEPKKAYDIIYKVVMRRADIIRGKKVDYIQKFVSRISSFYFLAPSI